MTAAPGFKPEIHGFPPLSPLGTAHAEALGTGVLRKGRKTMAKVEAFGMALGLFLTGILTFAALPLA